MKLNGVVTFFCLAGMLSSVAHAQTVPATAPAPQGGADGYSLGSVDTGSKPSVTGANQSASSAGYDLMGSATAGRRQSGELILTADIPEGSAPARFDNGIFVYPLVLLGIGHNDNVLGDRDDRTSSSITSLQPEIVAEIKTGGDRYTASYSGNYGIYADSRDDNFAHHDLKIAGDNYFSARARMGWMLGYLEQSDARGSTDRVQSDEPDKWHAPVLRGRFIYGAPEATGRVEADVQHMRKRYDNNRDVTVLSDLDMTEVAGRFLYRVAPRTLVLAEVRNKDTDYVRSEGPGSDEQRYLVGATWEATAATTGIVKLGMLKKDFTGASGRDFDGFSWEAAVRWQPTSFSVVDLETSREVADPTGIGNYVLNSGFDVLWQHKWTSYVTSRVALGTLESEFDGVDRTDKTYTYGFGVGYAMRRWLNLGVDWRHTDRSSSDSIFDFRRNVVMFTVEATL